jgi:hypothetical protein
MLWELSVTEQRYRTVLEVGAGVPVTEVRTSSPSAGSLGRSVRTELKMIFGTYSAQRAADNSLVPRTAACPCEMKDLGSQAFLQVTGPYRQDGSVGRVGLEPTTGGL